jgi:hypothetical protein
MRRIVFLASVALGMCSASPPLSATPIIVSYTGVLTEGYATNLFVQQPNDPPFYTGSLAGTSANITLRFNTGQGTFTEDTNSSSLTAIYPTRFAQASLFLSNGFNVSFGNFGGLGTDQAVIGSTQQAISFDVTDPFVEFGQLNASVFNSAIDPSIVQNTNLTNIPLQVSFSFGLGGNEDFHGSFNSGDFSISVPLPPAPEASTWAMLLIGFAGIGFAAYRRKRNFITA